MDIGDAGIFQVPENALKPNLDLNSFQDLKFLLHTVRYWGTNYIPLEVTQFLFSTWCYQEKEKRELREEFPEYWDTLRDLVAVTEASQHDKVSVAMELQLDLKTVVYMFEHESVVLNAGMCQSAARHNRLDCLQYLHERGCPWDAGTTSCALNYGNMECYKYAESHGCEVCAMVIARPDAFA